MCSVGCIAQARNSEDNLSLLPPLLALGMEPRQPVEEFPKLEGRVSQVLLFSLNGFFNGLFLL